MSVQSSKGMGVSINVNFLPFTISRPRLDNLWNQNKIIRVLQWERVESFLVQPPQGAPAKMSTSDGHLVTA